MGKKDKKLEQHDNRHDEINELIEKANYYLLRGNFKQAEHYYNSAASTCAEIYNPNYNAIHQTASRMTEALLADKKNSWKIDMAERLIRQDVLSVKSIAEVTDIEIEIVKHLSETIAQKEILQ